MSASLTSLPRPVVFGLYGGAVGVLVALTAGELVWGQLRPPPDPVPPAAPKPPPRLALTASPHVSLYAGETNAVALRVARAGFSGPVSVTFAPHAALTATEVTIAAGAGDGSAELTAPAAAAPGTHELTVTATATADGEPVAARATVSVTVAARPPPPPRLAVSTSPRLRAYQRGRNTFAVRIARGEFDAPVTVSFDQLPEGVEVPPVTIPAGRTEATGELAVANLAPAGTGTAAASARADPKEGTTSAAASAAVEAIGRPQVPVDVVFVLDCTGSMKKAVEGVSAGVQAFSDELRGAHLDVRFGLVGFQDTTLGQPLKVPRLGGERQSARPDALAAAMRAVRLGGGGGEGESSLDGLAEAADCPFRAGAVRALVLVTDGGPKRSDGRMKSADEAVKYLKAKPIDQLHVVALPDHKKAFEPLRAAAPGKFFDLSAPAGADQYAALMADVAKAIAGAIPEPPLEPLAPGDPAPEPVLPQPVSVRPPPLPPGAEPDVPKCESVPEAPAEGPEPDRAGGRRVLAGIVRSLALLVLVCGALAVGQLKFLPGPVPTGRIAAIGYASGVAAGLVAGAATFAALDALGMPLFGRIAAAGAFGLSLGAIAARGGRQTGAAAGPVLPPRQPNIVAPKSPDGCPGCGRVIPGAAGERYCMLCDRTF